MTLKDLADLAQLTLIPAILISLLGLWFNMHDNRRRAVEKRNAEWQKVVIYSMLDAAPLSLTEIRQELVTQATAFGLTELGLDRIRDISIRAAILELIAHNAVMRIPPETPTATDKYMVTRARIADPMEQIRAWDAHRSELMTQATAVRNIIEQNVGRFTEAELAQFIRQSTKLDNQVVDSLSNILGSLEVQGMIARSVDQKLYRVTRVPPPIPRGSPSTPS
jgi:hypothetical protein